MNKHKYRIILIALLFMAVCVNVFGASKNPYPFEVIKTGTGKQSIIFIPGFACSGDVWKETVANVAPSYTCYTLTMAGFAGVPAQENGTFAGWEKRIAEYIEEHKIEHPIVIGHSLGGGLALALAADYPNLISKIVVVDALPCLAAISNPAFKSKENNDCSAIVNQMTTMSDEQFYQMQKTSMIRLMADTTMQKTVVEWSVKSDRKTFGELYCDFSNTDLREKIKNIQCPTLILLESYFANMKPTIDEQYKNVKTATIQYANKGLHFIMYDDKDWYLSQLKNFISVQ